MNLILNPEISLGILVSLLAIPLGIFQIISLRIPSIIPPRVFRAFIQELLGNASKCSPDVFLSYHRKYPPGFSRKFVKNLLGKSSIIFMGIPPEVIREFLGFLHTKSFRGSRQCISITSLNSCIPAIVVL